MDGEFRGAGEYDGWGGAVGGRSARDGCAGRAGGCGDAGDVGSDGAVGTGDVGAGGTRGSWRAGGGGVGRAGVGDAKGGGVELFWIGSDGEGKGLGNLGGTDDEGRCGGHGDFVTVVEEEIVGVGLLDEDHGHGGRQCGAGELDHVVVGEDERGEVEMKDGEPGRVCRWSDGSDCALDIGAGGDGGAAGNENGFVRLGVEVRAWGGGGGEEWPGEGHLDGSAGGNGERGCGLCDECGLEREQQEERETHWTHLTG